MRTLVRLLPLVVISLAVATPSAGASRPVEKPGVAFRATLDGVGTFYGNCCSVFSSFQGVGSVPQLGRVAFAGYWNEKFAPEPPVIDPDFIPTSEFVLSLTTKRGEEVVLSGGFGTWTASGTHRGAPVTGSGTVTVSFAPGLAPPLDRVRVALAGTLVTK